MSRPVVIAGGGAAGDAVAFGLRKHGFEGEIAMISADAHPPYERPQLSKRFLRGDIPLEKVFLRPEGEHARQDIRLHLNRTIVDATAANHQLTLDEGTILEYETLVLATGATPRRLPDAPDLPNMLSLRSLGDSMELRSQLERAERVLLVGAGFIGAEIAASARQMRKTVLMLEAGPAILERAVGREVGEALAGIHRSRGVDLRTGTTVVEWEEKSGRLTAVRLSDGSHERIDLAVIGIGVQPNVGLADALGLEPAQGGVAVGEDLRAAAGIYAVGDIAAHLHPVFGRHLRVEHWQVAQRHGSAVAEAIAGGPKPYVELPWFWSDQWDVNLQYVGNSSGAARTVWRGDPAVEKFSVFYLHGQTVEAVLSVNDGRTGRFSRELISRHIPVDDAVLSDEQLDLREVARAAGADSDG